MSLSIVAAAYVRYEMGEKEWLNTIFQKKNLPAHFEQLLLNDSSKFKKIGDQIEALQISELVVQTASL